VSRFEKHWDQIRSNDRTMDDCAPHEEDWLGPTHDIFKDDPEFIEYRRRRAEIATKLHRKKKERSD